MRNIVVQTIAWTLALLCMAIIAGVLAWAMLAVWSAVLTIGG
jgi:hypothetical protein